MRSKLGTPSSPQATASPSMMQDRDRRRVERLDDQREAVGQVVARSGLSLPPSLPGAGTSAARSLSAPTAGPVISRQAALAVGCLGTRRHAHRDGTAGWDPASSVTRTAALVNGGALTAPHPEPILRLDGHPRP